MKILKREGGDGERDGVEPKRSGEGKERKKRVEKEKRR